MKKRLLRASLAAAMTIGLVGLPAGAALADSEVTVQPKDAIFNEAAYGTATEITFTAECGAGMTISWQKHAKTYTDPGDAGWTDVVDADTVDNSAKANTLKIAKTNLPDSAAGTLYRAKCTNGTTTVYSKPAGFWYIGLKQELLGETSRTIWPLPTLEVKEYQIYRVTAANKEVVLGLSMYFNELTVAETSPGNPDIRKLDLTNSKFNAWGNPCTVKWTNEKGEEVGTTADGGYKVTLSADEAKALDTKIIPTVSCEGSGVTQSPAATEWAKVAFATDFRYSEHSTEYGLFADPKWACIPDEAFGPDGKSTEKITYTWKVPNEDKGTSGDNLTAEIQLREQKEDPKQDEWNAADTMWKGVYKGSAAKPRWVWTAGPKAAPAYVKIDNNARTITIEGATKEQLNKYWIRILFTGAENLTPAPMWASSYAATRHTHFDRTPEHPNDLEQGDAVRYCTPWKLDGDREGGGLNIPRDVNNHRAKGTGTPDDPYSLYVEPGKPIVNFTADDWMDKYDGPNRFLHYYTRWDIYNEETKTWEPYIKQNLNATNSYLNVPLGKFKNGTMFRAYLADRVDGGYVYFKVTEVAKRPKLAKTGMNPSTLPLALAGLTTAAAGAGLVAMRRRRA